MVLPIYISNSDLTFLQQAFIYLFYKLVNEYRNRLFRLSTGEVRSLNNAAVQESKASVTKHTEAVREWRGQQVPPLLVKYRGALFLKNKHVPRVDVFLRSFGNRNVLALLT